VAVLIAGAGMAVIIACYAEGRVPVCRDGGTYLYVRHAFAGSRVTGGLADAAQPPHGVRRRGESAARLPGGSSGQSDSAAAETGRNHGYF